MTQRTLPSAERPLAVIAQVIWYVFDVIAVLLLLRFVLKLFGANTAAAFTQFFYGLTNPLVAPFVNVFTPVQTQGSLLEWSTLLALFVYWLIAFVVTQLLTLPQSTPSSEIHSA